MLHSPMMSAATTTIRSDASASNIFGSSCAMQDCLILKHPPLSTTTDDGNFSFDWSDFPVIYQHDEILSVPDQYAGQQTPSNPSEHPFTSQSQRHWQRQRQEEEYHKAEAQAENSRQDLENKRRRLKRVSWGSLEIRVHSLVLGDHPCCSGAIPLQLGWEYGDTELVNLDTYEQYKHYPPAANCQCTVSSTTRGRNLPPRLSYLERKNLLKRVTGMSERDLLDAMEEQKRMKHVSSSNAQLCDLVI